MTKSMTAYASASLETEQVVISWQLTSLNHRYLDINLRTGDALKAVEFRARECIQQQLGRGKIEASCHIQFRAGVETTIQLNTLKVDEVIAACNQIEMQMGVGQTINPLDVMRYPGVVDEGQPSALVDEELVLQVLEKALFSLNANRKQEGERLQLLVLERAKKVRDIIQTLRKRQPEVVLKIREKLEIRLNELTEQADNDRMQQELVYLAQKMDIDEELGRLMSHLVALQNAFSTDEPIGRRLDFLMQEFNREANTIASKSADVETTQGAVDLKVLIEQMREQVQNIE